MGGCKITTTAFLLLLLVVVVSSSCILLMYSGFFTQQQQQRQNDFTNNNNNNEQEGLLLSSSLRRSSSNLVVVVAVQDAANKQEEEEAAPAALFEPVDVIVCIEALCPDCRQYMLNEIIPTYEVLGGDSNVMNLTIIPFGNARIIDHEKLEDDDDEEEEESLDSDDDEYDISMASNKKIKIECQHGIAECDANSYIQCAIDLYRYDVDRYLPFIQCLDETLPTKYNSDETFSPSIYANCARESVLDYTRGIKYCHDDPIRSIQLQKHFQSLTPSNHEYVPWIMIDNIHIDEEQQSLLSYVCKAYVEKNHIHNNNDDDDRIPYACRSINSLSSSSSLILNEESTIE